MTPAILARLGGIHAQLGACHPKLARGQVWCRECGAIRKVDSAEAFRSGWPLCCGCTMTIDAPDERG
jgi:hypothetical protein